MKLTENIYKLDCTRGSYAYAILNGDSVTLIDTSYIGRGAAILQELFAQGVKPQSIKTILLTHCDGDHAGNIGYLTEQTGCEVYIDAEDLDVLRREKPAIGIKRLLGAFMRVRLPETIHPLPDGMIGDIQIIKTPGHTSGHSCFRYQNVLFAGDLVNGGNNAVLPAYAIFTPDKSAAFASSRSLNMSGVDWICPAHGEPVEASPAWDIFLKKYANKA